MAQYFRRISKLSTRPGPVNAISSSLHDAQTPAARADDGSRRAMRAELPPVEPTPVDRVDSSAAHELLRAPRPRGRPRLEGSEDRKPMGHRVPSALLRQLTLVAAELAYLE